MIPSNDLLRPDNQEASQMNQTKLQHCQYLQRQGRTLTEIAEAMGVDRSLIVGALYTDKVRDIVVPDPQLVPDRLPYAGRMA